MTLPIPLQEWKEYVLCEEPDSWEFLDFLRAKRALFRAMGGENEDKN